MTQGTIVISNGAGAAVRSAINTSNEAQATKQSGASAPSPTYPFMDWADTANDLLKQRNAANSAWIIKSTLSAEYGGLPANSITYDPGSPALLAATNVQDAIDELATRSTSGCWHLINTFNPSGAAAQSVTGFNASFYSDYRVIVDRLTMSNSASALYMRTSSDGGATFDSSAASYSWNVVVGYSAAATSTGNNSDTLISLASAVSNAASGIGLVDIFIPDPSPASPCVMKWGAEIASSSGGYSLLEGRCRRLASTAVNAVQIIASAGTLSGRIRLFGLTN